MINCALLNCQSINNKFLLINDVIVDNNLDALVMTETWHVCGSDIPLRRSAPSGYSIVEAARPGYAGDCATNHGGIAIVHSNNYAVRVITLPIRPTSFEVLACHFNTAKIVFITLYRPSSLNITELFFEEFISLLEIVSTYGSEIVLSGDFNIHVDDRNDVSARRLLDLLDAFDLQQHVTASTHACGHTLDLLITRPSLLPSNINVDVPVLSDHGLITYCLPQPRPPSVVKQRKEIRRLRDIDCDIFNDAVLRSSICAIENLTDCSVANLCDLYQTELRHIVDVMAPPVSVMVSSRLSMPWYDSDCRDCCRRVRALERRYRRSRLATDCLAWSTALQDKRALLASKEKHYWTTRLMSCAGDSKLLWHCLNSVLLRNTSSSLTPTTLTAQALADFFADKVAKVRVITSACPPAIFSGPCTARFDEFRPCTIAEVRQVMLQSPHKSCQLDPLPHTLLMASLEHVLPFLHMLCNKSLQSGILPDSEKSAAVTPILKKPSLDPDSASSYRPVSNLTYVSKLIERLACSQLTAYLLNHHLLPAEQSAYRQHYSTETATLKIASDIFDAADAEKVTVLALLDLSAAFDTVDHSILLQRLNYTYGVTGTALQWIKSFLTGRSFAVNFQGQQSTRSTLSCSVPQGSVTGPLLFNLYTADVIRIAQSFGVTVHCYADDLQLYVHCAVTEAPAALQRILSCIEAIDKWMGSNRLKLNPDKTQLIWLGTKQRLATLNINPVRLFDGTVIKPSTSVRNLGVIFDSELSMSEHVNSVTRTCFYHLRQLRFVRHSLTSDCAKMLVHAFVSSKVDYCNSLLYGATAQVTRRLQAVMNAAARLICGLRRLDHITPAVRDELHWLPVSQRVAYKVALLVYKCMHGTGPAYLTDYCTALTVADRHHQLRSVTRGDLVYPRTRTKRIGPRSFHSSGPAVWNSLPMYIRDTNLTLPQFKRHLKHYLFCVAYDITN